MMTNVFQFKHSRVAGARPNLTPGEIGVQLADGVLYIRSQGRKLAVDPVVVSTLGVPVGPLGAPATLSGGALSFLPSATPSALVDGLTQVDLAPNGYAIPGVAITGRAAPTGYKLTATTPLMESFHVASDRFVLTAFMFSSVNAPGGVIRLGLLDANGKVILSTTPTPLVGGANIVELDLLLPIGRYTAVLWSNLDLELNQLQTNPVEQGWSFDNGSNVLFTQRRLGAQADYSAVLGSPQVSTTITSSQPGELRCLLFDWALG